MTSKCHLAPFHISTTAGFYSTVAGVMAGFAFAALFYFITSSTNPRPAGEPESDADDPTPDRRDLAAQALGAAFVTLLLSSITYAILAGEPKSGGRSATIEVIAGIGFAVGAIHLFYAIVLMIRAHRRSMGSLERYFQNVGGLFLCPLACLMINLGVSDWEETKHDRAAELAYHFGWLSAGVVFIICSIAAVFSWCTNRRPPLSRWQNPSFFAVAIGGGAIAGTSIIGAAESECAAAAPIVIYVLIVATAVVLVNQALWFFWPPETFRP